MVPTVRGGVAGWLHSPCRRRSSTGPSFEEAVDLTHRLLDPVLAGPLDAVWEPASRRWRHGSLKRVPPKPALVNRQPGGGFRCRRMKRYRRSLTRLLPEGHGGFKSRGIAFLLVSEMLILVSEGGHAPLSPPLLTARLDLAAAA